MKRGVLAALLVSAMILTLAPTAAAPNAATTNAAGDEIRVTLYGQPLAVDQSPFLVDGVALVPLRGVAEALGAEVNWDEAGQTVTVRKGTTDVRLTINSAEAVKDGRPVRLEAAPRLVNGTTMAPVRFIGEAFDALVVWDDANRTVIVDRLPDLPTVGSYENFKALLEQAQQSRNSAFAANERAPAAGFTQGLTVIDQSATAGGATGAAPSAASDDSVKKKASAPVPASSEAKAEADYSRTNTQVEGVDEADVVKTDGTYIYQVNGQKIVIVRAYPSDEMKIASTIEFDEQTFRPNEVYVDDKHLIVIGSTFRKMDAYPLPMPGSTDTGAPAVSVEPTPAAKVKIAPSRTSQTVKAYVYDIADKTNPKQIRDVELDGRYVASRKIGSSLYLITNKYAYGPYLTRTAEPEAAEREAKANAPTYKDSALSNDYATIDYKDIRYFPDSFETNTMLVAGLNLDRPDQAMNVSAYLGSGQNVYASENNLYTAVTKYEPIRAEPFAQENGAAGTAAKDSFPLPQFERKTTVYKFRLEQGNTKYVAQGQVPGTVLNQFSMDEHNGHFRIATTKGEMWRTDEHTSKNNVYILDEAMKQVGKLEDIAPGERIYSVRFMGNRGYMVTFRNVDPLFVIDLANPAEPKILGALKIPGYSDYLHPYDENHIIGFGKDTVEMPVKGGPNDGDRTMAFYQGLKIALFDVSDVSNPKEKFKETIGDRGTHSELLHNHRALLFSREHDLLAFPVTVMEIPNKSANPDRSGFPAYGEFTFQGAYVYRLDLANGFVLRGKITHLTEEERQKAGKGWYDSRHNVERILYIGDTLYTLSKGMIKANDLLTLQEKNSLNLP